MIAKRNALPPRTAKSKGGQGAPRDEGTMAHSPRECEALARALLPHLIGELARLVSVAGSTTYTSRRGGGPAGVPDREWKRIAKGIGRLPYPGARWFVVERSAYLAWLGGTATPQAISPASNDGATKRGEEPWSPSAALASVGLRPTRGSR
jgi:hypothetical protein